jgi:predicted SprT family Zn-dependent metalloprotease
MSSFDGLAQRELDELCRRFPMGYRPRLQWKKLRVSAGVAYYGVGVIALSTVVLQSEEAVIETLRHEYAHLLAIFRYGKKAAGHGKEWKQAMLDLGLEPKIYHRYDVQRNKPRQTVTYQCARCGSLIQRARRLPSRRQYVHSKCGGEVLLHSVAPNR